MWVRVYPVKADFFADKIWGFKNSLHPHKWKVTWSYLWGADDRAPDPINSKVSDEYTCLLTWVCKVAYLGYAKLRTLGMHSCVRVSAGLQQPHPQPAHYWGLSRPAALISSLLSFLPLTPAAGHQLVIDRTSASAFVVGKVNWKQF